MSRIAAFVGHSFSDSDKDVVRQFLDYFDRIKKMDSGFSWEHAENAEPNILSEKVKRLMEDKNIFIGICTAKERVIQPDKLKKALVGNVLKAATKDFEWKTSDWIIQEVGFALGRNMQVILLLEEGVRVPGGLQGDLEHIPFVRTEPSKAFPKVLDMITSLVPKKMPGEMAATEKKADGEQKQHEESGSEHPLNPTAQWTREDYERALFTAIATANAQGEERIRTSFFETDEGKKEESQVAFKALTLHLRRSLEKEMELQELKALSEEHPQNSEAHWYLGLAYEAYKDFGKAAEQFELSVQYLETDRKLFVLCRAAQARAKDGQRDAEGWFLGHAQPLIKQAKDGERVVLMTLKEIAQLTNEDDKYLAYTERLLDLQPDNEYIRFSLAHKYSELNRNDLALFHYLLIPSFKRDHGDWNNIGVAYTRLDLNGKSVEAYRESEAAGGTLAMSNLAHKLISEGFLKEAEEICNRATKIKDYDMQVGTAITSIKKTREKEEEDEKKALEAAKPRRHFYIDFARACLKGSAADYTGVWHEQDCILKVSIAGTRFMAEGQYQKEEGLGLGALALRATSPPSIKKVTIMVRYEGKVTGHGVEFKKTEDKEGATPTILGALGPSKGLLILRDGLNGADVCIPGARGEDKFYELHKAQ